MCYDREQTTATVEDEPETVAESPADVPDVLDRLTNAVRAFIRELR